MSPKLIRSRVAMHIAARVFRCRSRPSVIGTFADPHFRGLAFEEAAAWVVFGSDQVVGFASYEWALHALVIGTVGAVFVSGDYPLANKMAQSGGVRVIQRILLPMPDLVFAGFKPAMPPEIGTLFVPARRDSLVSRLPAVRVHRKTEVCTDLSASRSVEQHGRDTACITNRHSADYFGLRTYSVLQAGETLPCRLLQLR